MMLIKNGSAEDTSDNRKLTEWYNFFGTGH